MVMKATVPTAYNNNNYYWRPKGLHMVHTIWKKNTKYRVMMQGGSYTCILIITSMEGITTASGGSESELMPGQKLIY